MPKALLIRNYQSDTQQSMLRFADVLEQGLPDFGWEVESVQPPAYFGKNSNTLSGTGKWLGYLDKYILARNPLRNFARQSKADLVHICDHSNAFYEPLFDDLPCLITCHDLLAIRIWRGEISQQQKSLTGKLQQRYIFSALRKSRHIACVSTQTESDLHRLAPETQGRTHLIPMGLNFPYEPLGTEEARRVLEGHTELQMFLQSKDGLKQFLLHLGSNSWYKNREGVLKIFKKMLDAQQSHDLSLIMVGPNPTEGMKALAKHMHNRILFVENLDNQCLQVLYSLASCFVFPSLAEGFGWPPIEAQACGCPVAVSDIEPLKSNCLNSALLLSPTDHDEAAGQLLQLLNDPQKLHSLKESGLSNAKHFSTRAMLQKYADTYQSLINHSVPAG